MNLVDFATSKVGNLAGSCPILINLCARGPVTELTVHGKPKWDTSAGEKRECRIFSSKAMSVETSEPGNYAVRNASFKAGDQILSQK